MPWNTSDAKKFNKSITTRRDARMWVAVANSALKTCMDKGGTDETCAPAAIQKANGVLKNRKKKEMAKEAMTKTMNGKSYPAASFLVVEDPAKPATWALPVKGPDGKPDHRLMGAAWAALHNGYRGKKYEGADKLSAIKKLKTMYQDENMETPAEAAEVETVAEYEGDYFAYVPSGVVSFDQYDALCQTEEQLHEIQELTNVFTQMVRNIVFWFDGDKIEQLRLTMAEYTDRLGELVNGPVPDEETTGEENEDITESASGAITLAEADGSNSVLEMDVVIIRPGWGNKVDNNYYPAEMLKRDALKFSGAKMYETDHRDNEKSTRTWVSTITDITGFNEEGAPIARVKVHDPDFAERVRNLNALGLLNKMECSIYATGKAVIGFEQDGRKGKKVTELLDVHSVDWVTKAGAGGKALSLVETDEGGGTMDDDKNTVENQETETTTEQEIPVTETEETPSAKTEQKTGETEITPAPVEPVYLDTETVNSVLAKSTLPEVGKFRLSQRQYTNEAELTEAIAGEVKYLTEAMGAGHPFGLGNPSTNSPKTAAEVESAVAEVANRVNSKYFSNPKFGG